MKYTKAEKVSLTISYSMMFLGFGGSVICSVVSAIGYFIQGLIGNAILSVLLTIVTAALSTAVIALHWDTMQELRRELKQGGKCVKTDVTPTDGVASDPGTAWTAFNNFLARYDALQEQYQCAVQRKNELSEENRQLKEQHDKLLEENHRFKSMIELKQWEQARLAKLEADEKEFEEYQTALLCGTLRLKDIPERMRMDPQRAGTLHILAFRADRGLSKEWYAEDLRFMEQEIELARSRSDTELEYMLKHVYEDASVTFDTYQWNKRED